MTMDLQRTIAYLAAAGIKTDSSNLLLNIGKLYQSRLNWTVGWIVADWIHRPRIHRLCCTAYEILGEEKHASSWSGAERIGLDLIQDELENIHSKDEFVKGRFILDETFPNGVYITDNFRFTTKPISGMRLSDYYWTESRTWFALPIGYS